MKTEIIIEEELVIKEIARTGNEFLEIYSFINDILKVNILNYVVEDMHNDSGDEILLTEYLYLLANEKVEHDLDFKVIDIDVETSTMIISTDDDVHKLDLREHPLYELYNIFKTVRIGYKGFKITK